MRGGIVALLGSVLVCMGCSIPRVTGEDAGARAARLAQQVLIVDAHIDLPYRLSRAPVDVAVRSSEGHFDLPRARAGGLDAAFMAIYVNASLPGGVAAQKRADELIDLVEAMVAAHPREMALARTPAEVRAAVRKGLFAVPMGLENGSPLTGVDDLEHFRRRGIAYVTLTHSENNELCDSSYSEARRWHGLSPLGRELVEAMNQQGVMVDVSHVSDEAFDQVVAIARAPVVATHSGCRAFTPGMERNLDDDRIRALAATGGMILLPFGTAFLTEAAHLQGVDTWRTVEARLTARGLTWESPEADAELEAYRREHPPVVVEVTALADHVDHVARLVGVDHVGLGSDFDGVSELPRGLQDVSGYPTLIAELLRRGYSEGDIRKICGENLLRVWERVLASAGR